MKVTLIIPTMNEGESIGKVLKEIPKKLIDEIIVIDGNSIDNTKKEAKSLLRNNKDKFIIQKKRGFGNALMQAFHESRGDVLIIMNGDGSHNPTDIKKLLEEIKKGSEYVIASRYAKGAGSDDDTIIRYVGNRILTRLTNIIHGTNVSDSLHFFTAITKKGVKKLRLTSPDFEFCIEILIKAHKSGLKFAEVPVIERARYAGESKVNALSAGWKILKTIVFLKI